MKIGVLGSKLVHSCPKAIDAIGEGEIEIIKTDGDLHPILQYMRLVVKEYSQCY